MERDFDNILKSDVHLKIIAFFHENQGSIDTPRGIATWTGHKRDVVKKVLAELARVGVIVAHRVSSTTGYSYTQNKKIIKAVEKKLNDLKK